MNKENIRDILLNKKIRKTQFRIELLEVFSNAKYGLSFKDLKEKITSTQDKVTIYRALAIFEKKGLIHKVPNTNDITKYALCQEECSEKTHNHNHIHFICSQCENTFCLNDIEIPELKTIKGYRVKKSNLTLEGDCPDCLSTSNQ